MGNFQISLSAAGTRTTCGRWTPIHVSIPTFLPSSLPKKTAWRVLADGKRTAGAGELGMSDLVMAGLIDAVFLAGQNWPMPALCQSLARWHAHGCQICPLASLAYSHASRPNLAQCPAPIRVSPCPYTPSFRRTRMDRPDFTALWRLYSAWLIVQCPHMSAHLEVSHGNWKQL